MTEGQRTTTKNLWSLVVLVYSLSPLSSKFNHSCLNVRREIKIEILIPSRGDLANFNYINKLEIRKKS